jgi:hypothetical protein
MTKDKDPDLGISLAIEQMIREVGQVCPAQIMRNEVITFWIFDDRVYDLIEFGVEPLPKFWATFCEIMRSNLTKVFSQFAMECDAHLTLPGGVPEFFERHTRFGIPIQFGIAQQRFGHTFVFVGQHDGQGVQKVRR